MVSSGASLSEVDDDNRTAMHHAAAKGSLTIIECLIGAGAKIDAVDNFGLTPLGEADRHSSRTGENKIRDCLIAAGADQSLSGSSLKQAKLLGIVLTSCQTLFFILFATCTDWDSRVNRDPEASADVLKTTYSMFMDVHVMIFIGFGFLMTFLRKYGHSSVGINFLLAAFTIQWHLLCHGFFAQAFAGNGFTKIGINLDSLLLADFASAVILISFGALLGKVSPVQMIVLAFFEVIWFNISEQVLLQIGILDVGGSIVVHLFGAYFGLTASRVLSAKSASSNNNNASVYHSDLFAMIGALFLWVYWPSFVASPANKYDQERAIIATTLSLTGSCVSAFLTSLALRRGKFSMVDVQNATLAGGVAIGSAANLTVLTPAEGLFIGVLGGLVSVFGYVKIQPFIERTLGVHDTCGVHNLHGMPAILAGVTSAIVIAYSGAPVTFQAHTSKEAYAATYGGLVTEERPASVQASFQLLCVLVSFAFAVVGGLVSALVALQFGNPDENMLFVDQSVWEVPSHELPFYFDTRGEINRQTIGYAIAQEASKHGGSVFVTAGGSRHGSSRHENSSHRGGIWNSQHTVPAFGSQPVTQATQEAISNELLNMKLDLVLQQTRTMGEANGGAAAASSADTV